MKSCQAALHKKETSGLIKFPKLKMDVGVKSTSDRDAYDE